MNKLVLVGLVFFMLLTSGCLNQTPATENNLEENPADIGEVASAGAGEQQEVQPPSAMPVSDAECKQIADANKFRAYYSNLDCTWFALSEEGIEECLNAGGSFMFDIGLNCFITYYNSSQGPPTNYDECIEIQGYEDTVNLIYGRASCGFILSEYGSYNKDYVKEIVENCPYETQTSMQDIETCTLIFSKPIKPINSIPQDYEECLNLGGMPYTLNDGPKTCDLILLKEDNEELYNECLDAEGETQTNYPGFSGPTESCKLTLIK